MRLRAVVTEEAGGEFIVSACVVADDEPPAFVGEQVVVSLDLALAFVEDLARQLGCPKDQVETIYNMEGLPPETDRH
jgi:hypothetical protein